MWIAWFSLHVSDVFLRRGIILQGMLIVLLIGSRDGSDLRALILLVFLTTKECDGVNEDM